MPDLDDLDRAFDSLARDLAHSPGPGAAAAISTARRRRRTRVGAVALAALVVVGGATAVPQLLGPGEDGVAANGGSARLDARALEAATKGWASGWETWERSSPNGGGYAVPCSAALGANDGPAAESYGVSRFVADARVSAMFAVRRFGDADLAASAQDASDWPSEPCATTTYVEVDGVRVRHDSMPDGADTSSSLWVGDVWSARIGADVAQLEVVTGSEVADPDVAEEVAEALVAGLRDGWTQLEEDVERGPEDPRSLPTWPDVDLEGALAGWRSASKVTPSSTPAIPCLDEQLYVDVEISGGGSTPHGLSHRITLYEDDTAGPEKVAAMVAQFRGCSRGDVRVETLANGVHLATYDLGGTEGRGALWFAANGDRAGYVGMSRADTPMPASARLDVAAALHEILHLPRD